MKKAAHQNQMLIPFDFGEIKKPNPENYWKKHFCFVPEIGGLACISDTVAFCETMGSNAYCYCMRVEVLEINENTARVKTTKEWQEACGVVGGANTAGNIWRVSADSLAPIFDRNLNN
jgi:hypothetical protein